MSRLGALFKTRGFRIRTAFWGGGAAAVGILVFLARFRPTWPWFSLWLFALLGGLGILSLPRVRRALNLSWFAVTLLTLAGVSFFTLYLFHVETHRQKSERLEVHGVYLEAGHQPVRVGVGYPDLDVRLEGSLYEFDRWSVEIRQVGEGRYVLGHLDQVDMLHLPGRVSWNPWGRTSEPVLGAKLGGGRWIVDDSVETGEGNTARFRLILLPEGRGGTLDWEGRRAPLTLGERLADRRLSGKLSRGLPLSDLAWDSIPHRRVAEDLTLTRIKGGRSFGRIRLSLPEYRLVSRGAGESLGLDSLPTLQDGDTIRVTSRGKRWAFALDRVPGISRVAAPMAVRFVRRPRPSGWALPSSEACGEDAHRCAVLSTRALPPPQAHFDLSGFGLDTARYSLLARLETDREGVRLVGADYREAFGYGVLHPIPALPASEGFPSTGILVRVHRTAQGQQSAVLLTVLGLFALVFGALLTVSGDDGLWGRRKDTTPNITAAWGFANVFLIFLGIRLALGLRVAYSPPFYDRAAATAVGLWITFGVMAVALGRWSSWTPLFWRLVRRLERPFSRLFLPGVNGKGTGPAGFLAGGNNRQEAREPGSSRKARLRTALGLAVMMASLGLLLWQRPEAAPSLLVAGTGIGAWMAMGLSRRHGHASILNRYPLSVITAEGAREDPSLALAMAAGASVVLALAIHAPWMGLVPVLLLLFLFGINHVLVRLDPTASPDRRAWAVFAILLALGEIVVAAFLPWPRAGALVLLGVGAAAALILRRSVGEEDAPLLRRAYEGFLAVGRAVFSGVGWIGFLIVLGFLVFLSAQTIPPFMRFALVFMLFLLAIRAGLACQRVLEKGDRRGQVEALGLLVVPIGVLLVFMLFDFGLGLVFFVPMFLTVLLSARIDRLPGILTGGSAVLVAAISLLAWSVLRPPVAPLRNAPDLPTFSAEFRDLGNGFADVLRKVGMGGPVTRASVRSIAASDPDLLEEALAFAGPGEALFAAAPSRDQVWGGRAYAASGLTGTGFAGTAVLGRGIPTAVSYAENTFSVYVLAEHGALGGLGVMLAYLALLVVVAVWIRGVHASIQETRLGLAVLAMTVGGVLWLTLPAVYVAASNLALVPLTGQNMPFLGLNSWADVVLVSGLATGIVFGLTALDEPAEAGGSS
jgi:hypothetical protein